MIWEVITIETYYVEKMDKPSIWCKLKTEADNCKIYAKIEKEKSIKKVVEKMKKKGIQRIVLDKELLDNKSFVNAVNSYQMQIFDGRWLIKYLSLEILDYVVSRASFTKEEIEIAITVNEITDLSIEIIKTIAKQYKKTTIVTNHISKLKKIEQEIYEKQGVLIVLTNNQKKSLTKAQIILNMDFNKEMLNKYKINESAIIINLEGDMKIEEKRFNGININDYEIEVGREEIIWRENMKKFRTKDLLESVIYMKDTYKNIRNKLNKNKVNIKELYGINGKIERFS